MNKPDLPKVGPGFFKSYAKQLDKTLDQLKPVAGIGISITEDETGTVISVDSGSDSGVVYVTGVSWDSDNGRLVISKSNGTEEYIEFSACP